MEKRKGIKRTMLAVGVGAAILAASTLAATLEAAPQQNAETSANASLAQQYIALRYQAASGGSLRGDINYPNAPVGIPLWQGAPLPYVQPDDGFQFSHWENADGQRLDVNKALIGEKTAVVTAVFIPDDGTEPPGATYVDIRFEAGPNGKIQGDSHFPHLRSGLRLSQFVIAPSPIADPGYAFGHWVDQNGENYGSSPNSSLLVLGSENLTFTAVFEPVNAKYTVSYQAAEHGTLQGQTSFSGIVYGSKIGDAAPLPTPVPDPGYRFDVWVIKSGLSLREYSSEALAARQVYGDLLFRARFVTADPLLNYAVNYVSGPNGTLSASGSYRMLKFGDKLDDVARPPTPRPDAGYMFSHYVDANGQEIDPATATVGDNTTTITAVFVALADQSAFDLSFKCVSEHGSLSGQCEFKSVPVGALISQTVTFPTPVPKPGYHFDRWACGPLLGDSHAIDPDTVVMSADTRTIWAEFAPNEPSYTIEYVAAAHGSLKETSTTQYPGIPEGARVLEPGRPEPYTLPDPGYEFSHWENRDGVRVDLMNIFVNAANARLTAIFVPKSGDPAEPESCGVTFSIAENGLALRDRNTGQDSQTIHFADAKAGEKLVDATSVPIAVPAYGYTLCRWVDSEGNTVTNDTLVSAKTTTVTATFVSLASIGDRNADGIPDAQQNVYTVQFEASAGGKLQGQTSWLFIGGKKGDGKALTLANLVSDKDFAAPTPVPDAYASFGGWSPNLRPDNFKIKGDTTYTAKFKQELCRVRFNASGSALLDLKIPKGTTLADNSVQIPTPTASKNKAFVGWQCPDGQVRDAQSVLAMVLENNAAFKAVFR